MLNMICSIQLNENSKHKICLLGMLNMICSIPLLNNKIRLIRLLGMLNMICSIRTNKIKNISTMFARYAEYDMFYTSVSS